MSSLLSSLSAIQGHPVKQPQGNLREWPSLQLCSAQPMQLYVAALLLGSPAFLSFCPIPFFSYPSTFSPDFIFGPQWLLYSKLGACSSCPPFLLPATPYRLPPGLTPPLGEVIALCVSMQTSLFSAFLILDYKCSCWQK